MHLTDNEHRTRSQIHVEITRQDTERKPAIIGSHVIHASNIPLAAGHSLTAPSALHRTAFTGGSLQGRKNDTDVPCVSYAFRNTWKDVTGVFLAFRPERPHLRNILLVQMPKHLVHPSSVIDGETEVQRWKGPLVSDRNSQDLPGNPGQTHLNLIIGGT